MNTGTGTHYYVMPRGGVFAVIEAATGTVAEKHPTRLDAVRAALARSA